jgi:adenine-specific DNA-methyltransferase
MIRGFLSSCSVDRRRPLVSYVSAVSNSQVKAAHELADLSREELIELLSERREDGIHIDFSGKANARKLYRRVRPRIARTLKKYSVGSEEDQARNLVIEGDNLQAMATLFRQRGQVDLVLADPPYNTGHDWRYNDRWEEDPNDPGLGKWVTAEDGARHTKWMRFMWPRLQMVKAMLKPTGVLAICIDHRELFRLGQMLDELFEEKNRLAIINWQKMYGAKNQDQGVSVTTEYVLVYARDAEQARTGKTVRSEVTAGGYRNNDKDPRGPWAPSDSTLMGAATHPGQVYAIQNPFTGRLHYPQQGRCWRNERAKMKAAVEEWGVAYEDVNLEDGLHPALVIKGVRDPQKATPADPVIKKARKAALKMRENEVWPRFFWRADRNRRPGEGELRYKTYEQDVKAGVVPTTFWASDEFDLLSLDAVSWEHELSGTTHAGQRELNAVVGRGHGFDTVKPLMLMQKIIQLWCPADGLVMDPFAGTGTTGHAVLASNAESGASRRFILIEQGRPERGDSYARSLTADRLKRVVSGRWKSKKEEPLEGGFRFWTLGKKVDAEALLKMEREDLADTIIASHFDASVRKREALVRFPRKVGYKYLVAHNDRSEGFFLIWNGPKGNLDFTEKTYEACAKEAAKAGLESRYHVYARLYVFQTSNVVFYQIPDRILTDFGLDLRGEPYHDMEP